MYFIAHLMSALNVPPLARRYLCCEENKGKPNVYETSASCQYRCSPQCTRRLFLGGEEEIDRILSKHSGS